MWDAIARDISRATGETFRIRERAAVTGGCISAAWRVTDGRRVYFVKTGAAAAREMFEGEAAALAEIALTKTVRVPNPVAAGHDVRSAWLVVEHIAMRPLDGPSARTLGEQLACMHRHTAAAFGWARDNAIGGTPQRNGWTPDWAAFWRERRLRPQLELARANGHGGRLQALGGRLMDTLDRLLEGHSPAPSLLHGDLWGGNAAAEASGAPVIFDPATYYGDREADIAMTELFGGFAAEFHAAYRAAWPLAPGYERRRTLYNLYHVLNHLNLFGGAYLRQAEAMTAELLASL